ncbi:MAG TPA: hypothetical protein VJ787_01400 [Thermoleophilia bacterium]|nr:hypothetical protein [Thermoleophilia bacterium]
MGKRIADGRCSHLLVIVLLAVVTCVVLAVAAGPAFAFGSWAHGNGTVNAQCFAGCHTGPSGISAGGTNAECQSCHTGFQEPNPAANQDCWSCHQPGQSMTPSQQQSGCTGVCHMQVPGTSSYTNDQTPHGVTPHYASAVKNCTICHGVAVSWTAPDASPHHDDVAQTAPTSASCTTCHGTPPIDGAASAHGNLQTGVDPTDCQHCHVGMGTAHPAASGLVKPTVVAAAATSGSNVIVSGTVKSGSTGLANFTGWVQWKGPADTDWDAGRQMAVTTGTSGAFTATITAPVAGTIYRVLFEGAMVGQTTYRPVLAAAVFPVKEAITLKLNGKTTIVTILFRKSVKATGVITPKLTSAQVVKLTVKKRRANGTWALVKTLSTAKVTGAYSKTYTPTSRGTFRMQAVLAATATHTKAVSPLRTFKVK